MNIYSLLVHPNRNSLNGALFDAANEYFTKNGHTVVVQDLFSVEQDLISASHAMYTTPSQTSMSNYMESWVKAAIQKDLPSFVESEISKLKQADLLYIQTPIWVYALPGLLKIYIEQVFVLNEFFKLDAPWSESDFKISSLIENKKVMFGITLGGSKSMVARVMGSVDKLIEPIRSQFKFIGYEFLDPHITWATTLRSEIPHKHYINDFVGFLPKALEWEQR